MQTELTFEEVRQWMLDGITSIQKAMSKWKNYDSDLVKLIRATCSENAVTNESVALQLFLYRWAERQGIEVRADRGAAFFSSYQQLVHLVNSITLSSPLAASYLSGNNPRGALERLSGEIIKHVWDMIGIEIDSETESILGIAIKIMTDNISPTLGI